MEIEESLMVEEYKKVRYSYEECTEKFHELLYSLIKESGIQVHSVSSRTKSIDKLYDKINRKEKVYAKLSEVTDLSGIRIICYFSDQVDKVAGIVQNDFKILDDFSIDKRKTLDPDKFGYLSLHYVVKLSEDRSKLLEYKRFKDFLCEIQIRSILQHAWAEIEHDLGYKSPIEIPRDIKRRFYRLAGLLELADDEFNRIKYEIEQYTKKVDAELLNSPEEILIDKVSLEHFIINSPIVRELDEIVASNVNSKIGGIGNISMYLSIIDYFNIKTIDELEKIITENKDEIIVFSKYWITSTAEIITIPKGLWLIYLGHVLIGKTHDEDKVINYLTTTLGYEDIRRGSLAKRIMNLYNEKSNKNKTA